MSKCNNKWDGFLNGKVKCVGYHRQEKFFTIGKVYDVVNGTIVSDTGYKYKGLTNIMKFLSNYYKFEIVGNEKIVVTHDCKTTTATLYRGNEKITATARCAPEDKFDFVVGAKLAIERLEAKVNPPKPKYYNGKVVCVESKFNSHFTVGKIYEIVDGKFTDNENNIRPQANEDVRVKTASDLREGYFSTWMYKFIPYVE